MLLVSIITSRILVSAASPPGRRRREQTAPAAELERAPTAGRVLMQAASPA
jgi:hypothetical protein